MNHVPASVFSTATNQKSIPISYENQIEMECGDLIFSSKFDSGNLTKVEQVDQKENEFQLWTSPDPNDSKNSTNCSWLHFGINGGIIGKTYTFTIMNMKKHQMLYQQGLQPFVKINYLHQIENGEESYYERLSCKPIVKENESGMELTFTFKYPDLSNPDANSNKNSNTSGLPLHHVNKGKKNKAKSNQTSNKKKSPTSQSIEGNKNQINDLESALHRISVSHSIHMKSLSSLDNITNPNPEAAKAEFDQEIIKKKIKSIQIYFAFCHPYSYTELQKDLHLLEANYGHVAKELHLSQNEGSSCTHSLQRTSTLNGSESELSLNLTSLSPDIPHDNIYLHRELLTRSLDGRRIDLITLTDTYGLQSNRLEPPFEDLNSNQENSLKQASYDRLGKDNHDNKEDENVDEMAVLSVDENHSHIFVGKETILISARVHPGEVPASHVLNGMINFLLRKDDPRARLLRRRFVFKIIPMLNPDGVARGHFRLDQNGVNLNRLYINPDPIKHPSIFAAVKVVERYSPPRPSATSVCQEGITLLNADTPQKQTNKISPSGSSTSSQSEGSSCNSSLKNRGKKKKTQTSFNPAASDKSNTNNNNNNNNNNANTTMEENGSAKTTFSHITTEENDTLTQSALGDDQNLSASTKNKNIAEIATKGLMNSREPAKVTLAPIFMYLDLHAHAMKRGCFLYGNSLDNMDDQVSTQLFPLLNTINNPHVDYDSCIFSRKFMNRLDSGDQGMSAEGTGRVYFYKKFNILHSYTVECNYNTGRLLNHVPAVLRKVGSSGKKAWVGGNSTSQRRNTNGKFPDIVKSNDPTKAMKKEELRIKYKGMGQQCRTTGINVSPSQTSEAMSSSLSPPSSTLRLVKSNRDPSPERFPSATCPKYTNLDWGSVGLGLLVSILDMKGCNPWTRVPNSRYRTTERAALTIAAQLRSKEIYNSYKNNSSREMHEKSKQYTTYINSSSNSTYTNHWAPSPRNKNLAFTSVIKSTPSETNDSLSTPTSLVNKSSLIGSTHSRKFSERQSNLKNVTGIPQTVLETGRHKKISFPNSSTISANANLKTSHSQSGSISSTQLSKDIKKCVGHTKHRRTPSISIPAGSSPFSENSKPFSLEGNGENSRSIDSLL